MDGDNTEQKGEREKNRGGSHRRALKQRYVRNCTKPFKMLHFASFIIFWLGLEKKCIVLSTTVLRYVLDEAKQELPAGIPASFTHCQHDLHFFVCQISHLLLGTTPRHKCIISATTIARTNLENLSVSIR